MNRNKTIFSIVLLIALLSGIVTSSQAMPVRQTTQPPGLLTYQGHLLDAAGEPVLDDTYLMTFSLWDASTGGIRLWGPEEHDVEITDGFFAVLGIIHRAFQFFQTFPEEHQIGGVVFGNQDPDPFKTGLVC